MTAVNLSGAMTGLDLARVARERDPALPVVCMTRNACGGLGQVWRGQQHPSHEPFARAQLVTALPGSSMPADH